MSSADSDSTYSHRQREVTKIAMLGTFPPLRGLSSYCLALTTALADLVQIEFISFKRLYPGFLYPGGNLKNDHTFPVTAHRNLMVKRNLNWYNPLTWLSAAIFSSADMLHAQWWSLPLALVYLCICGVFRLRGRRVVFTVHNVFSHERSRIFEAASRRLLKLGDHFIVHTEKNRRQLMDHFEIPRERISLIPHGCLDFHVRNHVDRDKIRRELGIRANQKSILLFGAIRPYKGVGTAINAFAEVFRQVPEALLLIAGKLWQRWEPYQEMIDRLGLSEAVKTYLDYVPSGEVYKYFEAADLVILPYDRFDSQSGVGSTAVSFRKPMIVTDVGGLPDLVEDRRYVVPPKDPQTMARRIIDCLKNPDKLAQMAIGAETVATEISWSSIAQKTWAVYNNLLGINTSPTRPNDPNHLNDQNEPYA